MTNDTISTKFCTKCGEIFPATPEYFNRDKIKRDGLSSRCKKCVAETAREFRDNHPGYQRAWYESNHEKAIEYARQYREDNHEQVIEATHQWRKANREKTIEYARQYRKDNPDKAPNSQRLYRQNNSQKIRIKNHRRYARKRNLPDTLTPQQWQRAISYFHGCCAVCERPLKDLFGTHTESIDHWIPLHHPDCPGTTSMNCVPLCHGEEGCNNKKNAKMPEQWLIETFGTRKAKQILERVETYFVWVQEQDSPS